MWKNLKAFYNKDDFNYSTGLVNPFKFHITFYKILVLFKVAEVEKVSWLDQNICICLTGSLATILSFISIWRGVKNFDILHITEAGTYFIIMFYELLIQTSTKLNLPQFNNLLKAMKEDFYYICTEGEKYRKKYFENQLLTWKICLFTWVFTATISFLIISVTFLLLLYYLATHNPEDEGSRPLLYPFWLPGVDFGKTPYYEIAFIYSDICCACYAYNYIFMIQTQIVWIRHITSKVDIIIWSIEDLMDGIHPATNAAESKHFSELIKERMRKIMGHHHAMFKVIEDYAGVYKKLLMFEQKCCGPQVCLTAYCTVTKFEKDGEIQPVLLLLCVATVVLQFIPNYLCTFLAEKTNAICDACWNTPFWDAGPIIRPYMVLVMQKALRPLPLQAPGFESFSLETFSKKMTSAYSFFNMLRQTDL